MPHQFVEAVCQRTSFCSRLLLYVFLSLGSGPVGIKTVEIWALLHKEVYQEWSSLGKWCFGRARVMSGDWFGRIHRMRFVVHAIWEATAIVDYKGPTLQNDIEYHAYPNWSKTTLLQNVVFHPNHVLQNEYWILTWPQKNMLQNVFRCLNISKTQQWLQIVRLQAHFLATKSCKFQDYTGPKSSQNVVVILTGIFISISIYSSLIDADAFVHRMLDLLASHLVQNLPYHLFQLAIVRHGKLDSCNVTRMVHVASCDMICFFSKYKSVYR